MLVWTIVLISLGIVTGLPASQLSSADMTGSDDSAAQNTNWKVNEQMIHLPREQLFQRLQRNTAESMPLDDNQTRYSVDKNNNLVTIWKRIVIDCKQQPLQKMLKLSSNEIFGQDNGNFQNLRMIFQHCFLNKDGIRF